MYNPSHHAIVFMEVLSMNEALKTQLKILKLSDIKPNFSELARLYDLDRRTVKKYYDGYEGKAAHRDKPSKLDKYYDIIKQKLSIKGANVRAVYEFILSERDPDIGTYSNFNKYIKSKGLKPKKLLWDIQDLKLPQEFRHRSTGKKMYRSKINLARSSPFRCLIINLGILDTPISLTNFIRQDRMYSTA